MLPAALLAAAAIAQSVILPAAPRALVAGDLDGDGTADIVALLVYSVHGSMAEISTPSPGVNDVEVQPAITEKRELRAFKVGAGGTLTPLGVPLAVGQEFQGLGSMGRAGPIIALTTAGTAFVQLERDAAGNAALHIVPHVALASLFASAENADLDEGMLVERRSPTGAPAIRVPTPRGIALVGLDGTRRDVESVYREVTSGGLGSLTLGLPRFTDVDRDGTFDAIDVRPYRDDAPRLAWRRGLGGANFAAPVEWDLRPLLTPPPAKDEKSSAARELVDVADVDADGTLDALVVERVAHADSLGQALKYMRGAKTMLLAFPLRPDAALPAEPKTRSTLTGFEWRIEQPDGRVSPLGDLDRDGKPELMTFTLDVGFFGLAKAALTKRLKVKLQPHLYRNGPTGFVEIEDALPEVALNVDFSKELSVRRALDLPGDLDGDGYVDFVHADGARIDVHRGRRDLKFGAEPDRTLELAGLPTARDGARFLDLDGDALVDVLAVEYLRDEDQDQDQDNVDVTRPVRLEVRLMAAPR